MNSSVRGVLPPLAVVVASAVVLAASGTLAEQPVLVLAAYVAAGIGWAWALRRARTGSVPLALVVVGAVLLRVIGLASDLRTSDDAPRVVWEGAVLLDGASPYAFAPDAPELAHLARERPRWHAAVSHPEVSAAYPPLVQVAGMLAAASAADDDAPDAGVRFLRVLFAAIDLCALWPLVALLRRRGLPDGLALVWGWCPLAVFEIAGAGHLEALALTPLLGALALGERARSRRGAVGAAGLFALAILGKVLPIVLLPWFARALGGGSGTDGAVRVGWGRAGLRTAGWSALVLVLVAIGCAPFVEPFSTLRGADGGLLAGLSEYALRWDGLNVVHRFVEGAWSLEYERDLSWTDPRRLARVCALVVFLAWAYRTWRRERDPARAALDLFGAWIVVTPILHPWYALWCVPWLAVRGAHAFTWLAVVAPLAFAPVVGWQRDGAWVEPVWLWPFVVVPFVLSLAWSRARAHAREPA